MSDSTTNGYGKVQCKPSIGNSQTYLNKKKPRHYYERDSRWKEATWTPIYQNSSKPYDTQGSITMIPWYSTSLPTDCQLRCTRTSTPTNNPARTNNGGKKLSNSKKPLY